MKIFSVAIISYLIGSFSSAYVLGKLVMKVDIRTYGSGNAGATNAVRLMGKKFGVICFLLDFSKGIIATIIGIGIMGNVGGLIAAIFSVLGHNWPIYFGFKGGKGVSTTIGTLAVLNFPTALVSVIIGVSTGIISRYVSLGSIVFFLITPIVNILMGNTDRNYLITTTILGTIGLYKHKTNIKRLINKTENRMGKDKKR